MLLYWLGSRCSSWSRTSFKLSIKLRRSGSRSLLGALLLFLLALPASIYGHHGGGSEGDSPSSGVLPAPASLGVVLQRHLNKHKLASHILIGGGEGLLVALLLLLLVVELLLEVCLLLMLLLLHMFLLLLIHILLVLLVLLLAHAMVVHVQVCSEVVYVDCTRVVWMEGRQGDGDGLWCQY